MSIAEFLKKYTATCDFPGEVWTPCPHPPSRSTHVAKGLNISLSLIYVPTLCVQEAKAQARLFTSAGLSQPWLLADVISTNIFVLPNEYNYYMFCLFMPGVLWLYYIHVSYPDIELLTFSCTLCIRKLLIFIQLSDITMVRKFQYSRNKMIRKLLIFSFSTLIIE